MEQLKELKHDAHVYAWALSVFTFRPNKTQIVLGPGRLVAVDGPPAVGIGRGLLKPIYWMPDEESRLHCAHVDAYWDKFYNFTDITPLEDSLSVYHEVVPEWNNPHCVTAAQIGLYDGFVDIPPVWEGTPDDVIDVEAREIKDVPLLENNNGTTDEIRRDDSDVLGTEGKD